MSKRSKEILNELDRLISKFSSSKEVEDFSYVEQVVALVKELGPTNGFWKCVDGWLEKLREIEPYNPIVPIKILEEYHDEHFAQSTEIGPLITRLEEAAEPESIRCLTDSLCKMLDKHSAYPIRKRYIKRIRRVAEGYACAMPDVCDRLHIMVGG